ncbi:MaoC/PaaZ C-terminal domain-containing protein [Roseomonas gilardii]|uniref:MaoC/PaaZ C-terminal domain-containing protein n=1 Tax=Roseomonas gilardii TaxID=257708 RepID=A0ABU3MLG9_9PROT|nr:MaoC/PaaZ C-terminal domain-containing protein [Roseomonas gilardii]MDT8333859.1 MaoC/PaaZ C-terminal domain-containing protein [Roseomonas gilardii]
MRGKCIEDFRIGQVDTTRSRTITETDVVMFSWLSGDTNPMHTDAEHAKRSPLGQRIAHGALGLSICTGLSASVGYLEGTAIAALGIDEWRYLEPIYFGDTVRLRATVISARPTSKPDRGVLVRRMELINHHDEVVQSGLMTTMVLTRAGAEALQKSSRVQAGGRQ